MENMFKDLDTIYELTNKIDVTSKARNISDKFDDELINIKKRENNMNKYFEKKSEDNRDGTAFNRAVPWSWETAIGGGARQRAVYVQCG